MEISNIKILPNDNVEVTFCNEPDYEDFMSITFTPDILWQLSDFCREYLSYGAKLKNKK